MSSTTKVKLKKWLKVQKLISVIECVLIEYEKKKEGNNQCQCGSWQCICQWHIWLFTPGIDETPFYIQIFVGTSHFQNYSYYLVRLLQISIDRYGFSIICSIEFNSLLSLRNYVFVFFISIKSDHRFYEIIVPQK